ncbi:MAG: TolC family protein [Prevotellaceae bacterium]|jgi:outer membrane protein TolC|nr:TolC family protein [Prevotellaceae bacterium]
MFKINYFGAKKIGFQRYLLVFALAAACFVGRAQSSVDLKCCIETALKNNFSLKIIRNDEEISRNNYTRGNAGYLPTVGASGGYSGSLRNTVSENFDHVRTSANGLAGNGLSGGINLNWNLFSGFSVSTTYEKLRELQNVGELKTRIAVENLVGSVIAEYYYLIQQERLAENLKYVLSLSRERLRITSIHYELGSRSKLELLQAQVDFNTDSTRLVDQGQNMLSGKIRLKTLMGTLHEGYEIDTFDSVILLSGALDYNDLHTAALSNNANLLLAAKQNNISELDLKIIRAQSLPYLRFNTGLEYAYNGFNKGSTRMSQNYGMTYGLTLGINIFDGFNRKRQINNQKIAIRSAELYVMDSEQQLIASLLESFNSHKKNLKLLEMEKENFVTATAHYKDASERYMLGELAGIELREAQTNVRDAEERLLNVEYHIKLDEIMLMTLAGRIDEYIR